MSVRSHARGVLAGLAIGVVIAGCIAQRAVPREITGTCAGACDHYVDCKGQHGNKTLRAQCETECPDVFADPRSLATFESLSCPQTIEFVDGRIPRSAGVK